MIDVGAWWGQSFGAYADWAKILSSGMLLAAIIYFGAYFVPKRKPASFTQTRFRYQVMDVTLILIGVIAVALVHLHSRAHS